MTSQTINLDLIPSGVAPIIHVSQYDKGQTWNFNIFKEGQPFTIPTGASVAIQGTKLDNTGFQYPCTYSGSVVEATETDQMTIFRGNVTAEIAISYSGSLIGSANFIIQVEKAALADDVVISDTDLPLLQEAIEAAQESIAYSKDAEAWAVGTRDGSPVPSSDPAYENNAKYYAENFIGMITDAQWAAIQTILS